MRIRNGNRFPFSYNSDGSMSQVFHAEELEDIKVISFAVFDEEKFKEISPKKINDLHNYVRQANNINNHASDENSSSKLNKGMHLADASPSQKMANVEDAGGEDSEKGKSNSFCDNQMGKKFCTATISRQQATLDSSSAGKVIASVYKTEETISSKRIQNICQHLKQSESSNPNGGIGRLYKEVARATYDLRPRCMGKAIKLKSLDCIGKDNQMPTDTEDKQEDDTLIVDMLSEEIKEKLTGNLDRGNVTD